MSYKLTDAELSWLDTSHAKRAGGRLTHEELGWLDSIFTQVNEELHETVSKLGVAPLRHHVQDAQATGLERVSLRLNRGLIKRVFLPTPLPVRCCSTPAHPPPVTMGAVSPRRAPGPRATKWVPIS